MVKNEINITEKKTVAFASKMALRKVQLTEVKFSSQRVLNMSAGNANVPTNVFSPLASVSETKLNLKYWNMAILLLEMEKAILFAIYKRQIAKLTNVKFTFQQDTLRE